MERWSSVAKKILRIASNYYQLRSDLQSNRVTKGLIRFN